MKKTVGKIISSMMLTLALVSCSGSDNKEDAKYPSKDINVLVAYKAGGGTDVGARILTKEARNEFDKNLVILNRPGSDGIIGFTELAKAKPDGYTIGFINLPNYTSLSLTREVEFDTDSIIPIINHVYDEGIFVVKADSKWNSIEDFVEDARKNPNTYTISNNGAGASNHIGAATFTKEAGIEVKHIPYGGSTDMITALRGNHVDATVAKVSEILPLVKSGELKVLASFTEERVEVLEDTPTLMEKGYNVIFGSSRALAAPAGTPDEIIKYLHDKFKKVIESDAHMEAAKTANLPIKYMSSEELKIFMKNEEEMLKISLKELGFLD